MRDHLSINNAITMILAPNLASYSQTKKGRGPIDNAIITHSTIYSLSNFLHRDFYGSETRKIRILNLLHLSLCPVYSLKLLTPWWKVAILWTSSLFLLVRDKEDMALAEITFLTSNRHRASLPLRSCCAFNLNCLS